MCTLNDFLSTNFRFIHTSTVSVTGSDSFYGKKKHAYASRTSCLHKIIDVVLLRTTIRGIGAYSPDLFQIVQVDAFWSIFESFLLRKCTKKYFVNKSNR